MRAINTLSSIYYVIEFILLIQLLPFFMYNIHTYVCMYTMKKWVVITLLMYYRDIEMLGGKFCGKRGKYHLKGKGLKGKNRGKGKCK